MSPSNDRASDEHATVLPDVLTGVFASMECLRGGESVAVTGCGPTGVAAVICARLLGAGPIFAIDHLENRLAIAEKLGAIPSSAVSSSNACDLNRLSQNRPLQPSS